jgi:tetratricopeptide (TPR) repeat protein
MSDPLKNPLTGADGESRGSTGDQQAAAERDAKIESLLLAGLDHYFVSDYAQAIDVWTRALFLDRGHARARAYIERARSALGEQQRESEELIHNGVAAFERGEIESARELLNAAVQRGGAHEVALAFLTRIDRVRAVPAPAPDAPVIPPARTPLQPATLPPRRRSTVLLSALFGVCVLAMVAYVLASWDQVRALIPGAASQADLVPVRTVEDPLVIPRSSETALDRAKALFASGRLYDAMRATELVRPTDPLRNEADKLKEAIQRELLAHAPAVPAPADVSATP